MTGDPSNENPHSPDTIERQTADDGFSAGWGMQYPAFRTLHRGLPYTLPMQ